MLQERPPTPEYEDTDMVLALRARRESENAAANADGDEDDQDYSQYSEDGEEVEVFRLVRRDGGQVLERAGKL